jgi:hypothetical protein
MPAYSGLFEDSYSLLHTRAPSSGVVQRLAHRRWFAPYRRMIQGLINEGLSTGNAFVLVTTRLQIAEDNVGPGGGIRTIESVTQVPQHTFATADATALRKIVGITFDRGSYPGDLSGNGAPALASGASATT